ncbi:unnamed protein product [Prunus armeniaca]
MELSPIIAAAIQQITVKYTAEHSRGTNMANARRQARTQKSTQRNTTKAQIRHVHEDRNDTNTIDERTLQHDTQTQEGTHGTSREKKYKDRTRVGTTHRSPEKLALMPSQTI